MATAGTTRAAPDSASSVNHGGTFIAHDGPDSDRRGHPQPPSLAVLARPLSLSEPHARRLLTAPPRHLHSAGPGVIRRETRSPRTLQTPPGSRAPRAGQGRGREEHCAAAQERARARARAQPSCGWRWRAAGCGPRTVSPGGGRLRPWRRRWRLLRAQTLASRCASGALRSATREVRAPQIIIRETF